MELLTKTEKETIEKEVKGQFNRLIDAVSQLDAGAWSEYYSKDEFFSAIAGTAYYPTRNAWVDLITDYFSMRERQHLEPFEVCVNALSPSLALMTSQEKTEMKMKSGEDIRCRHVFTMIWKKEQEGWKILHSHESWVEEPKP